MINVALVLVLTYLYKIDQYLRIKINLKVNIHVEIPINEVTFLELVGLVFDTSIILKDKLEVRRQTSLEQVDRYFYETISKLHIDNDSHYIPFK